MDDVRYEAPESPDAATSLLADAGSSGRVFAGGTDVMVQIHAELIDPGVIVDIKKIPGTQGISESDGAYTFGAATAGMCGRRDLQHRWAKWRADSAGRRHCDRSWQNVFGGWRVHHVLLDAETRGSFRGCLFAADTTD